jgi:acyl-CoA thioesterase I
MNEIYKAFLSQICHCSTHPGSRVLFPNQRGMTFNRRIVFLGDSITDGHTYPLLVREAIGSKGCPAPVVINAGVGGDTAAGMRRRIDDTVLVHQPSLVTLSAGINDAIQNVHLEVYAENVRAIADRLRDEGVPLVLLTTSVFGAKHAEDERRTGTYNAWLRAFAVERGLAIAEVDRLLHQLREEKGDAFFMEPDSVHPNWEGQRMIARAVLDALGHTDAVVPTQLTPSLLPGIVTPWRLRAALDDQPLTEAAAHALLAEIMDQGSLTEWCEISLPDAEPLDDPWKYQERQRGFAISVDRGFPNCSRIQGVAFVENPLDHQQPVFFNTGAQLQAVWLNGERIYHHDQWRGWHAGRERILLRVTIIT